VRMSTADARPECVLGTASPTSRRSATLPPSEIRRMMDEAWRRPGTIRLEVGQPNFPTPEHVVAAAAEAAQRGETGYAPNAGIPALRDALAAKVTERNGYSTSPSQIVVTNGATEALYTTLRALTDEGDEILVPDPAWPNYRMIAHLLGLTVRSYHLRPEANFLPDPDELESLVNPRTRVILVLSPSNPLGTVLSAECAVSLVDIADRHGLWLLADEVYDELVFDGEHTSVAAAAPSDRIVTIYSFSKVYAMCGWRVGYVVAPVALAQLIIDLQEPITSCVNTFAQHGAISAIAGPQDAVVTMRDAYRRRRDAVLAELDGKGLPAFRPTGAFYMWLDISSSGLTAPAFAHAMLHQHSVAIAPGTAFGETGRHAARISLAASEADLVEGCRRMTALYSSLRGA
jgi:aspartate aminotransferase